MPSVLAVPDVQFAPAFPLWVVATVGAVVWVWAALLYLRVRFGQSRLSRTFFAALRLAALLILVACLLNPISFTVVRGERERVCLLLDDSASMTIKDASGGVARWDAARDLTARVGAAIEKADRYAVQSFTFGMELKPLGGDPPAVPAQARTDLPAAILDALASGAEGSFAPGPPAAVFVVTDGASNVPAQTSSLLESLGRARVPVYIALVGSAQPLCDVRIARVAATRKVALKTDVHLDVDVAVRNIPETVKTQVRLRDAGQTVDSRTIELKNGVHRVPFDFTPDRKGLLTYTVVVEPVPGEALTENNSEDVIVECDRRQLHVLYMEGSQYRREGQALWEYQFLVQALEEDPDVRVTPLFKDDMSAAKKAGVYWIRHPTEGFPTTRRRLFEYDVVISSDIDIEYFTSEQLRNLVDFVGQRGGGFVMIGGYTAFGAGGYEKSIIDKILPVEMQGRSDGYFEDYDAQFRPKLTPDGLRHPLCRIDADPVKNLKIWEAIPPFGGFNYVWRAKHLATILAAHPNRMNKFGNYIFLAVQQYGRGRTMAFTSDTTAGWGASFETEWGADTDNRHYRKLWQNAIRWLAAYRIDGAPRPILLSVDSNQYAPGDTVRVTAQVFDENYDPSDEAQINATVKKPGSDISSLQFTGVSGVRGSYEAELKVNRSGVYVVRANAVLGDRSVGEDTVTFACNDRRIELKDYEPDEDLLAQIAEASGGKVFKSDDSAGITEVAAVLRTDRQTAGRRYRTLWDRWFVLTALCGLLSAEWYLRRRRGLP